MSEPNSLADHIFTGNIYIFHAFDIGDDIDLQKVEESHEIITRPLKLPKYFKNYHMPLPIDLPHPHTSSRCISTHIHGFGVVSFIYKIPFESSLSELKKQLTQIESMYQEQSVEDINSVYKKIKQYIKQPRLFHLRKSYVVIQVHEQKNIKSVAELQTLYGSTIASLVRFEPGILSEYQKNEILADARGYYRGDLIIIDTEAAFVCDKEYEEILPLFEFANIQHLELQYYDRLLDRQLNVAYQREIRKIPLKTYLPFIGSLIKDPVSALGMLKVEISAIIERLESSIKLAGETYISETYELLVEKMDLQSWQESINKKFEIINDINLIYQHKTDAIREDLLTVSIIVLILLELILGMHK